MTNELHDHTQMIPRLSRRTLIIAAIVVVLLDFAALVITRWLGYWDLFNLLLKISTYGLPLLIIVISLSYLRGRRQNSMDTYEGSSGPPGPPEPWPAPGDET